MTNQFEKHQLLILSQHFEIYKHLISQSCLPGLTIVAVREPEDALRSGTECDLLFGEPSLVSKVLNQLPKIKWVQTTWAGVDPLLRADMRRDYMLTNARNVYGPMISEYVFGYLLMIERSILSRWQAQLERRWDDRPHGNLKGKLIGLLGVGSIGSHLAATAHHFGMRVHGYTLHSETCPDVDQYFHGDEWNRFATDLDYLVCTLPGTSATRGMVNARFLAALPGSAWLVNTGRGSTVNENDLAEALNRGSLAGAVLDVFEEEPLSPDHPLWSTPNTFITFHTAARNYPPDIARLFIDNYNRLVKGEPLQYRVDFDAGY